MFHKNFKPREQKPPFQFVFFHQSFVVASRVYQLFCTCAQRKAFFPHYLRFFSPTANTKTANSKGYLRVCDTCFCVNVCFCVCVFEVIIILPLMLNQMNKYLTVSGHNRPQTTIWSSSISCRKFPPLPPRSIDS